jgi:hypothetical protein
VVEPHKQIALSLVTTHAPHTHLSYTSPRVLAVLASGSIDMAASAYKSKEEAFGVVSRGAPPRLSTSSDEEEGRARKKARSWDESVGAVPSDAFTSPRGWTPSSWRALPVSHPPITLLVHACMRTPRIPIWPPSPHSQAVYTHFGQVELGDATKVAETLAHSFHTRACLKVHVGVG